MKLFSHIYVLLLLAIPFHPAVAGTSETKRGRNYILYAGTYTRSDSKGIYAYRFDAASGRVTSLGLAAETANPSFLAADGERLYAVNELPQYNGTPGGTVTAFAIDRHSGKLSRLDQQTTRGADPCYISIDKTGQYALVANYTGASVTVLPILRNGQLAAPTAFIQNTGSGPNHERQEGPHAHWIETTGDNRFAIAADLGIDRVLVYHFDAQTGSLTPNDPPAAKVAPGSGPRHLAFGRGEKFAYVINELQSTITAFSYDAAHGILQPIQTIPTLPQDFHGANTAAEIAVHPSGKFLYASNRGHDSIAAFSIAENTGHLALIGFFPSQGKTPRHFAIDPTATRLLVANQDSSNIVLFSIDTATGKLTETSQIRDVPSPVCLLFVSAD